MSDQWRRREGPCDLGVWNRNGGKCDAPTVSNDAADADRLHNLKNFTDTGYPGNHVTRRPGASDGPSSSEK